jgi:hypothetical protein
MTNEELQEENEGLTATCAELEENFNRLAQNYDALQASVRDKREERKIPLLYKISIGLGLVAVAGIIASVVLFTSSPKESFDQVVCAVSCATYTAERTDTVWMYYPVLWATCLALLTGAGLAIGRAMHDSI